MSKRLSPTPPPAAALVVAAPIAAGVLGISRRQFDRLVAARVVPQLGPRQFDLAAVVPAFVAYIERGREGSATMAEARLATEIQRAKRLELENGARAGELVALQDVAQFWGDCIGNAKARLLRLPSECAGRVPVAQRGIVSAAVTQAVHDALRELADYQPDRGAA